jgi:hypothetical protein
MERVLGRGRAPQKGNDAHDAHDPLSLRILCPLVVETEESVGLNRKEIIDLYRRRARHYDFTAQLYYLAGFREWAYRERAVAALRLNPGDTVVDIGCGTGLNFMLLQEAVGSRGNHRG